MQFRDEVITRFSSMKGEQFWLFFENSDYFYPQEFKDNRQNKKIKLRKNAQFFKPDRLVQKTPVSFEQLYQWSFVHKKIAKLPQNFFFKSQSVDKQKLPIVVYDRLNQRFLIYRGNLSVCPGESQGKNLSDNFCAL